jgi:hypothetical protein
MKWVLRTGATGLANIPEIGVNNMIKEFQVVMFETNTGRNFQYLVQSMLQMACTSNRNWKGGMLAQ